MPARPTALITGASSGIGEALATLFARDGYRLVLVARGAARLRALATRLADEHGVPTLAMPADLSHPDAAARLAARLGRRRVVLDVLVNSAGVLETGLFVRMPASLHRRLVDLNVAGLTAMLAQFVPGMVRRGRGRVLNIASVAAFQPLPTLATYAATKAYVLSLSESLAEELRDSGVTVTALCPGVTATPMLARAKRGRRSVARLPDLLIGDVGQVAAEGYRACLAGEAIAVPGALNLVATTATQIAPRWLVRRVGGTVGRRFL